MEKTVTLTKKELDLIDEAFGLLDGGLWYDCIDSEDVDSLKTREEVIKFIDETEDLGRGDFALLVIRMVELIREEESK